MIIEFFVPGKAAPSGSKKGIYNHKLNRVMIIDDNPKSVKNWRGSVQSFAMGAMNGVDMLTGPLRLVVTFYMARPKSHYGTGKNANKLKSSARIYPTVRPDVTKLIRGLEDALNGLVWKDDSQIVVQVVNKQYTDETPGCFVKIETLNEKGVSHADQKSQFHQG